MKSWVTILAFILVLTKTGVTQTPTWVKNLPFEEKSFIENKGQLTGKFSDALYSSKINGVTVYFFKDRWEYVYTDVQFGEEAWEREHGEEHDEEETEEEREKEFENKFIEHSLTLEWKGALPATELVVEDKKSFYSTYAPNRYDYNPVTIVANEFGKLTYKNIYPFTDLIVEFKEDTLGLKYSFVLHPGANVADIQMHIKNADGISINKNGNLEIQTSMGLFTDHAPYSHWKKINIPLDSKYKLNGNVVSFDLPDIKGPVGMEFIIDPWVINPGFTVQNRAFDVDKDDAGNVFVYGGQNPWSLKKFNSAGVAQWTYNTTYASWYGDLAVINTGDAFITEGCCGGGFQRINAAGGVVWSQNFGVLELWTLAFDCSFTTLYLGKGYPDNRLHTMDINTGAFIAMSASFGGSGGNEPRSLCWGPGNNMYMLLCTPTNNIVGVNPGLGTFYSVPNGYALVYNGPAYANGSNPTAAQNGVAAGLNFVATSNGQTVFKRDLNTGASLGTTVVAGGIAENNSGVLVDYCDNVFAGSQNAIVAYDQNLVQTGTTATTGAVYCLAPGLNGDVLGCGNGFVGAYALGYQTQNFTLTTSNTPASCGCTGTATVNVTFNCNPTPVTINWSNGQTGNTATNLCAGTYTVIVTTLTCLNDTAFVTVGGGGGGGGSGFPVNAVGTNVTCNGTANGSITTNPAGVPGYTYSWNTGATSQNLTGLAPGTYIVTVTDASACTGVDTIIITQPPLLTAAFSSTPDTCASADGTATVITGGGTPGYAFLWSNGGGTSVITGLTSGPYSVTVTDLNGCTAITNGNVGVFNTTPVVNVVSPSATITCTFPTQTLSSNSPTPGVTFSWAGPGIVSGASTTTPVVNAAGNYVVTVTDGNGCQANNTVNVPIDTASPDLTVAPPPVLACGSSANLNASSLTAGVTFAWVGPGIVSGANTNSPVVNLQGVYTVTVTNPANGCTQIGTTTVTTSGGPTALQINITNPVCNQNNGCIQVTGVTGGTAAYTYSIGGAFSATTNYCSLAPGSYTVSVQDQNLCQYDTVVTLVNSGVLTAQISSFQNVSCFGAADGSAQISIVGGTAPFALIDSATGGIQNNVIFPFTVTPLAPGSYGYTISDALGCSANVSFVITEPALLAVTLNGTTPVCQGVASALLTNVSGGTAPYVYAWNNALPPNANQNVTPAATTTYIVVVTDDNGCAATDTVVITVINVVMPVITSDATSGCEDLCVQFTNTSAVGAGAVYSWDFGDGTHSAVAAPLHCYTSAGQFDVSLSIVEQGCASSATVNNMITVYPTPLAAFQANPNIVNLLNPQVNFQNQSVGANSYNWNFGDGTFSGQQNPGHTYQDTGTYVVTLIVTSINGCTDTVTGNVWVTDYFAFYAPNAFSPDGDGLNDVWQGIGTGISDDEFELFIFDRWGDRIFSANKISQFWDGTHKGIKCKTDVYVWKVKLKDSFGVYHQYYGHISLIR